ncbi:MAG: nucleoside triphosphate pyrophosphohydrolase [Dehalococcoidia bacterium]|nr:nucleoside triphosphate pyrophosphohydrolase [Dehalococcoidia bacterium]
MSKKAEIPQDLRRFDSLVQIMAVLRGPEGCPWDREQTHESLRDSLLEESYEALEALDAGDKGELKAELGDLLLQVVMHARLGQESGDFDIGDVVEGVSRKLIYRHPHVFGDDDAENADAVLARWEGLKKKERGDERGMLDGVPKSLPALSYAQSVQERVARVGFDWQNDEGVIEKLTEEIAEFRQAASQKEKEREFGDVLFTLVNYARRQGIDPESALRTANHKFYTRFAHMEKLCRRRGLDMAKMTLDEQNKLWDEAKKETSASDILDTD